MSKIDYNKTRKYWNQDLEQKKLGKYSSGYIMPVELENVALYRFNKELKFLNKFGRFGGNYLDLGCGTGNFIYKWHNRFNHLTGIDFSKPLIKIAKKQCKKLKNVTIVRDNIINFEKYLKKGEKIKFIFIGGCFSYLNDNDVSNLIQKLFHRIDNDGALIFREPTATKKRIFDNNKGYMCIRRKIEEYEKLILLDKDKYVINYYQNYSVNYTHFISLYLKIFPFLKNIINIFNNFLVEFFFLYLPLKIYTQLKRNMVLYHFFVVKNND